MIEPIDSAEKKYKTKLDSLLRIILIWLSVVNRAMRRLPLFFEVKVLAISPRPETETGSCSDV
jgi:hypothetical protein